MTRIEHEKKIVERMIRLYCQRCERNAELCPQCESLLIYAVKRLDNCPHGENKPTCRVCPIHCYRSDMREEMRKVMRWSGPRLILYQPLAVFAHYMRELRFHLSNPKSAPNH